MIDPVKFGGRLGRLVVGQVRTVYRVEGRNFLRPSDAYYAIAKRMVTARYSLVIAFLTDNGEWIDVDEALVDEEDQAFHCGLATDAGADVVAYRARAARAKRLFFRRHGEPTGPEDKPAGLHFDDAMWRRHVKRVADKLARWETAARHRAGGGTGPGRGR